MTIDIPLGLSGKQLVTSLRLWKARGDDRGGGVDVGGSVGLELGGRKKGLCGGEWGVGWSGGEELNGIDLKSLE